MEDLKGGRGMFFLGVLVVVVVVGWSRCGETAAVMYIREMKRKLTI